MSLINAAVLEHKDGLHLHAGHVCTGRISAVSRHWNEANLNRKKGA